LLYGFLQPLSAWCCQPLQDRFKNKTEGGENMKNTLNKKGGLLSLIGGVVVVIVLVVLFFRYF